MRCLGKKKVREKGKRRNESFSLIWAGALTLNLQVLLGLEVFDRRVVHDADHRHAVVLPADGEGQAAGDGVHLVVAQLHSGLPCRGGGGGRQQRHQDVKGGKPKTTQDWRGWKSEQSSEGTSTVWLGLVQKALHWQKPLEKSFVL